MAVRRHQSAVCPPMRMNERFTCFPASQTTANTERDQEILFRAKYGGLKPRPKLIQKVGLRIMRCMHSRAGEGRGKAVLRHGVGAGWASRRHRHHYGAAFEHLKHINAGACACWHPCACAGLYGPLRARRRAQAWPGACVCSLCGRILHASSFWFLFVSLHHPGCRFVSVLSQLLGLWC